MFESGNKQLIEFTLAFRQSFKKYLYGPVEERIQPVLDKGSFQSLGAYFGYQHGEYCEMTCQAMSVSSENLIAVIDKYHTKALDMHRKNEDRFVRYNSGFNDAQVDVLEKIMSDDASFSQLPEVDEDDLMSVGYYDGYSYFLNDFVQNGLKRYSDDDDPSMIEDISRACFNKRENNVAEEKGQAK